MEWEEVLKNALYMLALLNPASKLLFLSTYEPPLTTRQVFELSWKSSLAALAILATFAIIGQIVLKDVFRIDMYSLNITGGFVLFFVGWTAIQQGRFFQKRDHDIRDDFNEISIVPLATPLIAGPGTITIAISFAAEAGHSACLSALVLALTINFIIMLFSLPLGKVLHRVHLVGPLIGITGLIVATVAVQMILSGVSAWLASVKSAM
ncbi:MAG: MarC family protein [Victivallales bacterium]|jgi:multiple antibiotic resistance protein|nr:MarC family protein [Victivallales bacterium]